MALAGAPLRLQEQGICDFPGGPRHGLPQRVKEHHHDCRQDNFFNQINYLRPRLGLAPALHGDRREACKTSPMHGDDPAQVEAVAAAIRSHLRRYPLAADSASGVARWWLGSEFIGVPVQQIERALDLLVARQAMCSLRLLDGTLLYSHAAGWDDRVRCVSDQESSSPGPLRPARRSR